MRRFLLCAFTALVLRAAETNAPPASTNSLSLNWVLSEVSRNNPALKAAQANWRAMCERIPQARAWEDLRGGVDVERHGTISPLRYSDTEWTVAQEFPVSGKNRLRAKIATSEAATAFLEARRRELDLGTKARTAYARLANGYAQYDLNARNRDVWKQFAEISRKKYEVGTLPQADVLMAETELARIEETLITNAKEISDAQSQLNVLMNRPPGEALPKPSVPEPVGYSLTIERLQQVAIEQRPELQIAEAKGAAAKHRIQLARKQWVPDPEFRIEARQVNGAGGVINEYDTGVFIRFPWFNRGKYRAAIRESEEMAESAEHELEASKTETLGLINDHWKKLQALHHHFELSRSRLLPLAHETVASRRNAYATDKATFLELLTAQLALQEIESMYWTHRTDYQIALAELEAQLGVSLERISQLDSNGKTK